MSPLETYQPKLPVRLQPLRLRQGSLALSQCVFGPLAILDIESHRVPLDDFPRLIA